MRTDILALGFAYYRLSIEEAQGGESSSISNQRMIVQNYCRQHGITIVREFVDDGFSGGNFDRPAFQDMMRQLQQGKANIVITKDLSRLGRDMRESSYYAEQFFPEHGIHYIAIGDNFDTERENIMAPFLFAMNEVYLRDFVLCHLGAVALVVAACQYAAEHFRVERLYAAAEYRRVGGHVLHLAALVAKRLDEALRAAGREELHALRVELLKQLFQPVFVEHGDKRGLDFFLVSHSINI